MSEDIVERLRKVEGLHADGFYKAFGEGDWGSVISAICGEGATEIERLRADIIILKQMGQFKERA
jgi:hypothetical protein